MHAALAAGTGGVIWTNAFDATLKVDADGEQLLRILLNIGRNAVQALDGRTDASIRVDAQRQNNKVAIDIADNGPGVPEAVLPSLFEPFSRRGRSEGSGLGLAIARELARAHGGDVSVLKTGAEGTVFRLTLPDVLAEQGGDT
jgi:signal transduction histidine kinase